MSANARRSVVFLGVAGAGKSFLINQITAETKAIVGTSLNKDGTTELQKIPYEGIDFVDTPGLDSKNVKTNMTELIQSNCKNDLILICLVIDRSVKRLTTWLQNFEDTKRQLVGESKFIVVIANEGSKVSPEKREEYENIFPAAELFDSTDSAFLASFKLILEDETKFTNLLISQNQNGKVNSNLTTNTKLSIPKQNQIGKVNSNSVTNQKVDDRENLAVLPVKWNSLSKFKGKIKNVKKVSLEKDIKNVIDVKMNATDDFRLLHVLGDSYFGTFVLYYLRAIDEKNICTQQEQIVRNGTNTDTSPLCLFYDKYVKEIHDKLIPNEANSLSTHGKADVVEALIAQLSFDNASRISLMFCFKELLEFAKMYKK